MRLDNYRDRLFLSPHYDDVALSCGGLAASGGGTCLTVFGGAPPTDEGLTEVARLVLAEGGLGSAAESMRRRADEDHRAMAVLGLHAEAWDELEVTFRDDRLASSFLATMGPPTDGDLRLAGELAERLAERLDRRTLVVAPLGVGGHVDHVVVFEAARVLARLGHPVVHYEDYPYSDLVVASPIVDLAARARAGQAFTEDELVAALTGQGAARPAADRVAARLAELGVSATPECVPVAATLAARVAASCAYASQIAGLFGERDPAEALNAFARSLGGGTPVERYWYFADEAK